MFFRFLQRKQVLCPIPTTDLRHEKNMIERCMV
jgi:hypothetical protein